MSVGAVEADGRKAAGSDVRRLMGVTREPYPLGRKATSRAGFVSSRGGDGLPVWMRSMQ